MNKTPGGGTRMSVAADKQVILLDNKTIAAFSLLRLCDAPVKWSITALNHNIRHVGGGLVPNFNASDLRRIALHIKKAHPLWDAKIQEISTRLKTDDRHRYKEVKKAAVFIWCGGLCIMTFHNQSVDCWQLMGTMNAIIEAACFFFGGPEHRPKAKDTFLAVSQSSDSYTVNRWRAGDGCSTYDAAFPVRHQYEGDIDINRDALPHSTAGPFPPAVPPLTGFVPSERSNKCLVPQWKIADLFSAPFLDGHVATLPLQHKRPAHDMFAHGARATGKLLLPLYYPPPMGPLLQFTIYQYLVYDDPSSEGDDFLLDQLKVLSEQYKRLSQVLYALSRKLYTSGEQLRCTTMHFEYLSKSVLYNSVYDLYSRSCDIQKQLISPSLLLEYEINLLNNFWQQHKCVSEQFGHVRSEFLQPFPEHNCEVCRQRDEFPRFPSPLSYEELLGCDGRELPMPIAPLESFDRGYCLTQEQVDKLIASMSAAPTSREPDVQFEEQVINPVSSTTAFPHSLVTDKQIDNVLGSHPAGDDPLTAPGMPPMESGGYLARHPHSHAVYTGVFGSAAVSYERAEHEFITPERPTKRRKIAGDEASSTTHQ